MKNRYFAIVVSFFLAAAVSCNWIDYRGKEPSSPQEPSEPAPRPGPSDPNPGDGGGEDGPGAENPPETGCQWSGNPAGEPGKWHDMPQGGRLFVSDSSSVDLSMAIEVVGEEPSFICQGSQVVFLSTNKALILEDAYVIGSRIEVSGAETGYETEIVGSDVMDSTVKDSYLLDSNVKNSDIDSCDLLRVEAEDSSMRMAFISQAAVSNSSLDNVWEPEIAGYDPSQGQAGDNLSILFSSVSDSLVWDSSIVSSSTVESSSVVSSQVESSVVAGPSTDLSSVSESSVKGGSHLVAPSVSNSNLLNVQGQNCVLDGADLQNQECGDPLPQQ